MKHPILVITAVLQLSITFAFAEPDPKEPATQGSSKLESLATSFIDQAQKKQKDISSKTSDIMKRSQDLLDQQEAQMKRFDKILKTWERQQKEYQAYLDTLPKKQKTEQGAAANP